MPDYILLFRILDFIDRHYLAMPPIKINLPVNGEIMAKPCYRPQSKELLLSFRSEFPAKIS
jgi:hypothetical protein